MIDTPSSRLSVWLLGDQLLEDHSAIRAARESGLPFRVVIIESYRRAQNLPYHRKKLVLLFSAMRHFAQQLQQDGIAVDYQRAPDFLTGLMNHVRSWQPNHMLFMSASQAAGRNFQFNLEQRLGIAVSILPPAQFLTGSFDPFPQLDPDKRVLMENFYRRMRGHFQVLMQPSGEPEGGRWNFDQQNRLPLPKGISIPEPPAFQPDEITLQVIGEVDALPLGVGRTIGFGLAVTHAQAKLALDDFIQRRLAHFGEYEDAMSHAHSTLFHSCLSPYLNTGLLKPLQVVRAVEQAYRHGKAPLNSAEGFIRQVMGWREYINWMYWRRISKWEADNHWRAERSLPSWFWNGQVRMRCMKTALRRALDTGYLHHIERLMLISNFAQLSGVRPLAVNHWFLACFIDAYEWVMLPNVLGMGLYADGGQLASKPYIASANYINRMSDFCDECQYDPKLRRGKGACPFNVLYWNFLIMHEAALRRNPRMGKSLLGLRRLGAEERREITSDANRLLENLDELSG